MNIDFYTRQELITTTLDLLTTGKVWEYAQDNKGTNPDLYSALQAIIDALVLSLLEDEDAVALLPPSVSMAVAKQTEAAFNTTYKDLVDLGLPERFVPTIKIKDKVELRKGEKFAEDLRKKAQIELERAWVRDNHVFLISENAYLRRRNSIWSDRNRIVKAALLTEFQELFDDRATNMLSRVPSLSERVFVPTYDRVIQRGQERTFNMFQRSSMLEPRAGDWSEVEKLVLNLVGGVQEHKEWLLDFLAKPLKAIYKHQTIELLPAAAMLVGVPGTGKNLLGDKILQKIYGDGYGKIDSNALAGKFNGQMAFKTLLFADEVFAEEQTRETVSNGLKTIIGNPTFGIEDKNVSRKTIRNYGHFLLATNKGQPGMPPPLHLEEGDRRFTVLYGDKPLEAVHPGLGELIAADTDKKGAGMAAAFLAHLLSRDVTRSFQVPLDTPLRREWQGSVIPTEQAFANYVLNHGLRETAREVGLEAEIGWVGEHVEGDAVPRQGYLSDYVTKVYTAWCAFRKVRPRGRYFIAGMEKVWSVKGITRERVRWKGGQSFIWIGLPVGEEPVGSDAIEDTRLATVTQLRPQPSA